MVFRLGWSNAWASRAVIGEEKARNFFHSCFKHLSPAAFLGIQPRGEIWRSQSDPKTYRCFDSTPRLPQREAYGLRDCAILLTLLPAFLFWRAESWCHSSQFYTAVLETTTSVVGRVSSPSSRAYCLGPSLCSLLLGSSASSLHLFELADSTWLQSLLLALQLKQDAASVSQTQKSWMVPGERMPVLGLRWWRWQHLAGKDTPHTCVKQAWLLKWLSDNTVPCLQWDSRKAKARTSKTEHAFPPRNRT